MYNIPYSDSGSYAYDKPVNGVNCPNCGTTDVVVEIKKSGYHVFFRCRKCGYRKKQD